MLSRWFGPRYDRASFPDEAPLATLRFVVLDTEMTSLDARSNRLLSVGAIAMQGRSIHLGEQFYRLANPGVEMPVAGVVIHQLRPHDVSGAAPPADVLEGLRQFCHDAVIVGHFVGLDLALLRKEGLRLAQPAVDTALVQSWIHARRLAPEQLEEKLSQLDLATLARLYGLDFQQAHHALDDAFLTARLWQRMLASLESLGITRLRRLLRISGV